MPETVALTRVREYDAARLDAATGRVLDACGPTVRPGDRVLVKPNLVNAANAQHCTTHPLVVRSVCAWLLDHGVRVTVGDSPAFGPAARVARISGLATALSGLGLTVESLGRPVPLALTGGGTIGVSADALEADRILNLPKLKAHGQMAISGAVKNLFGCVVGFRKALAHYSMGHSHEIFRSMIMDVYAALPRTHHLMDGVRVLHKNGPVNGEPFSLGLLGAAKNGAALDTAACTLIGLTPEQVPLWTEAKARALPGSRQEDIVYPLARPGDFDAAGFVHAAERELSFRPLRLIRGRIRSLMEHLEK